MGDTLMGITSVPATWPIVFFTSLPPGNYLQGTFDAVHGDWDPFGSTTVGAAGAYNIFSEASAIAGTVPERALFAITDAGRTNPLDGFPATAWTSPVPVNPYILGDPVLTGAPGDHLVDLNWTTPPVAAADPRSELIYSVLRGTSSPPATTIVSSLLVTTYVSTGLTNGTTYYHRAGVDLRIVGAAAPISQLGRFSNIVSNVPAVQPLVESWGAIAR